MQQRQGSRERIAYHEAGHAVVSCVLGHKILRIEVFPHKEFGFAGFVLDDRDDHPSSLAEIEKSVCICYAGNIAESIKFVSSEDRPSVLGLMDKVKASDLLRKHFSEDEAKETGRLLREHTEKLLRENWLAVEALVTKLLTDNLIDGVLALDIINTARKHTEVSQE